MRTLNRMLFGALVLTLVGFFIGIPAVAQEEDCPRPANASEVQPPSVTAAQVAAGTGDLREFALAARRFLDGLQTGEDIVYAACLIRHEGPWKSGSTYIVTLSPDGRIFAHSDMAALSGRRLEDSLYRSIAQAVGLSRTGTIGNPEGGALQGGGYAAGYRDNSPHILVAGLDIQETQLAQETVDPGSPAVRADQVVDRATLKAFVDGATDYLVTLFRTEGRSAFAKAKSVFRDPNGRWRHGPVYLFIMEPTGYTLFHGAFPDKFEFQAPTTTLRDIVTGELILPQIIRTARTPGGGFVKYFFDNPDDDTDRADLPKLTYARQHVFERTGPDGNTVAIPLIFGAGIYGDPTTLSEDICPRPPGLAANPLASPAVTATDVAAGSGSLMDFATAAKDYLESIATPQELGYAGCLMRNEGPWKVGSTYLAALTLDGRVLFNGHDMATGGRPLNRSTYGAILAAVGIDVTADISAQLRSAAATGSFPNLVGGTVPGIGGYAIGYGATIPYILLAGLDLQESHFAPDSLPPGDPEVRADEVVDRRTLKKFVNGAIDYLMGINRTRPTEVIGIARSILRRPPWRHGPVYLFMMDPDGYTHLHAAFPNRFEFQTPTDTLRDVVTQELILPQIIEVAEKPQGGFVQYYFDNPADDSDSADVPKVTYARKVEFTVDIPGVGPITNSVIVGSGIYGDPVSKESAASTRGWLARFGRVVAGEAVEMISGRMDSPSGTKMVLAGQTVNRGDNATLPRGRDGFAPMAGRDLAHWDGENLLTTGFPPGARSLSLSDLLARSSFQLPAAKGADDPDGRRWTAWGRGSLTKFEGGGAAALEGDVTTGMLGVDYAKGGWLGGVALSQARGKGGFDNEGRSEMEATLTSVYPYVGLALNERISAWGILGMGRGEMSLDEQVIEKVVETDIEMRMGAFGFRGALLSASKTGAFDLALKSDLLLTQVDADGKDGLEAITAETRRIRLMLEAAREIATEGRGSLRPALEVGLRHDGGDVDEGMGLELGGSVRFAGAGLTMQVNARALLTHAEEDVKEWGIGGLVRLDPGQAGRGLALTVEPAVGSAASGAARLWSLRDASRLADERVDLEPRVRAEVGYGLGAMGGMLTPYASLSVSETERETYRVGVRFRVGERLSMSLEGDRREHARDENASHGVVLQGLIRW